MALFIVQYIGRIHTTLIKRLVVNMYKFVFYYVAVF